jgi:hypothetical protein
VPRHPFIPEALILDNSTEHFLGTERSPIIARHTLGYQLTSAGIDRAGTEGAWLLPVDPDASARALHDALTIHTGAEIAVVIADSDGRADRRGATVISIGATGIAALRTTEHGVGQTDQERGRPQPVARRKVAGDQRSQRDRAVPSYSGKLTSSRVPPPGGLAIFEVPPKASTRSSMPTSPDPHVGSAPPTPSSCTANNRE